MSVDVLMLEPTGRGGIAQFNHLLCAALTDVGVRVHLITREGWELATWPRLYTVSPLLAARQPYATSLRHLHRLVRAMRPAIVHAQTSISTRKDALLVAWLRRLGPRVMVTAHNVVPHEARWADVVGQGALYQAADHVLAYNTASRDAVMARFRVPAARVSVVPLGNYAPFATGAPPRAEARQRLGVHDDEPLVLFFGAVRPYKGLDVLIDAFPAVRRTSPRARLLVAGEVQVGDVTTYRRHAERLGIAAAVTFTDRYLPFEQVACHLRAADVAVFPYRRVWESGAVHVAVALECPIVASAAGGVAEIVRDGESGRLVPAGDAEALARAISETLSDPASAAARARRALDDEHRLRGWPVVATRMAALYRQLAGAAQS